MSCQLGNFPQSHVVSARHSYSQRTSQDKSQDWDLPFQTQGDPAKTYTDMGTGQTRIDSMSPSAKTQAPYWNEVNGMWQPVGFSFFCISFFVHQLLAQPSLGRKLELTEGVSQLCKCASHSHTMTAPNASLPTPTLVVVTTDNLESNTFGAG